MNAKPQLKQSMQEEQIRTALDTHWHASRYGSILEMAEACDVPVRWACRTGVCHNFGFGGGRLRTGATRQAGRWEPSRLLFAAEERCRHRFVKLQRPDSQRGWSADHEKRL